MDNKVKELRGILKLSQHQMAHVLNIKQNAYSSIETGKVSLTDRNKNRLIERFCVNPDWWDGSSNKVFTVDDPVSEIAVWGILQNNPIDSPYKKIDSAKEQTRPRIPYTAAAGSLTSAVEGVTESECEQIPVITAFPSYDFTMFVKGDSMYPNLEGGDEVACKRIDSTSFIQWGKVHVLDTAQGIVIKRVYNDDGNVKCVSYNKEYPDFTISKEEVYSMSLVVGMIRL